MKYKSSGEYGRFTPLRDLANAMLHRAKMKYRLAMTRRDRAFCEGYEQAVNDFILEIRDIQKTYIWEYKIREEVKDQ